MWRLTMLLLCLIAALSGTPLRQAEAASDLVRSLVERGEDHVEMIDGGVGDDADVAVLEAGSDSRSVPAAFPMAASTGLLMPFRPASSSPGDADRRWPDRIAPLLMGSSQRHAWIQCFLF